MDDLNAKDAFHFSIEALADLANRAFKGYIAGDARFSPASYANFLAQENVHLMLSQVVLQDQVPVGFALVARRGWTSRLAAMGVVPEAKSQGTGTWLLNRVSGMAQVRGDQAFELECFEENEPGMRLYRRAGFKVVRRLYGYHREAQPLNETEKEDKPDLIEMDLLEAACMIIEHGAPDLPWQCSGWTLARMGPPYRAFRAGPACVVMTGLSAPQVALRGLLVEPGERGKGHGRRLLEALFSRFPEKKWVVPQICPEETGGFFERLGFSRHPLNQVQMVKSLKNA